MKKSGLGIGLEELLGLSSDKNFDSNDNTNSGVEEVFLSEIVTNVNQPRKNFDSSALEELASSIKNFGVIQPILVCKVGSKYQIVAGERRFRASKLAGLEKVPVIIKNFTVQQRKEIALIENLQRQDLNPIEEACAYKALIDEYNFTQEELADKLGKSRPVITNALRLLTLNSAVIDMVSCGRLSAGHARALVPVKDANLQIAYANAACDKQMSVRQLEILVFNYLNPDKLQKKIKPVLTTELKDLINSMQYVFGTKIKAMGNNNHGRIYIDYFNQDDLDRIFSIVKALEREK